MTKLLAVLIVLSVSFLAHAQEIPALVPHTVQTICSRDGKIRLQFDNNEHPEVHAWLFSTDNPNGRKALGDTFFLVQDVSISPTNKWIIVKNGTASAGTSLLIFRQKEDLDYKQAGGVDPEGALKMLIQEKKLPKTFGAAHAHLSVIGWLNEDVGSFVLRLSGDGGPEGRQTNYFNWFGLYDSAKSKLTPLNEKILTPFNN